MDSRGNRAAWLSGPEKSRHLRQTPVCAGAAAFGFNFSNSARLGREDRGTGGGEEGLEGGGVGIVERSGRFEGSGGGFAAEDLLSPNSSAERLGVGGGSTTFWRDGRLGSDGGRSLALGRPLGADTVGLSGRRGSSFTFLSGNAGSVEGSYSGALMRFFGYWLPEPTLKLVRVETADITEERPELIDDTDSTDCFLVRLCASDGLLGGREGGAFSDAACEGLRGGSEGTGLSSFSAFSHFARRGAGSTSLGPAG
jgi:hypothetical protein